MPILPGDPSPQRRRSSFSRSYVRKRLPAHLPPVLLLVPFFSSQTLEQAHQEQGPSAIRRSPRSPQTNGFSCSPSQGSISEFLEIMGPLENLLPPSTGSQFYVGQLKNCIKMKDFDGGRLIHVRLVKLGLERDCLTLNVLLDMYVKLGCMGDGVQLFDEMRERDLVSWCTLISGFVSHGLHLQALCFFDKLQKCGMNMNDFVVASVLKACAAAEALQLGVQIHGLSCKSGFLQDGFVSAGLVDMYAKCGLLRESNKLFKELSVKSSVSWNTLISGYVWNRRFKEAIETCLLMCRMGYMMDLVTLRIVISAGSTLQRVIFCNNLYAYSTKIGLDTDYFVALEFLKLLAMVGEPVLWKIFCTVKFPDATLYSCIISTYHQHGHRLEALDVAEELLGSNTNLNEGAIVTLLNVCQAVEEGMQMHAHLVKSGYMSCLSVCNSLISTYIRCDKFEDASSLFFHMSLHDLISWTTLMAGLVRHHEFKGAVELFCAFRETELLLDHYIVATMINASSGLRDLVQGEQFHSLAWKFGFKSYEFITTSLIHMYSKCGYIEASSLLFSSLSHPHNLVSVNVILSGYLCNLHADKVIEVFGKEIKMGLVPDKFSFSVVLGACSELRSMEMGVQIHACIIKTGFEQFDVVIGNAIMNLYIKCRDLDGTCKSFCSIICKDPNSYALMMTGYVQNKDSVKALKLFHQMQRSGLCPSPAASSVTLRACADVSAFCLGKQIHALAYKVGCISDICVANAMVGMYAKSSYVQEARKVFNEMIVRDDVVWNALITGYSHIGNRDEAFEAFELMKQEDIYQDYYSYVGLLNVCSGWAALSHGMCVHALVVQMGLDSDVSVGNALIDMYAKCGSIKDSWKVFQKMEVKDVVSWNAMVSGYGQHGLANEALKVFEEMQRDGLIPDHVTYLAVLSACSHVGLVDEGLIHFKSMMRNHGVVAGEAHYACMVDILSRAGRLDEAHKFINKMPIKPTRLIWRTLLAACTSHGNMELGVMVAWKILDNEEDDSTMFVLLSNVYAMCGRWMDVESVRKVMRGKGLKKEPACSWIEIENGLEFFLVGGERRKGAFQLLFQYPKCSRDFGFHPLDHG